MVFNACLSCTACWQIRFLCVHWCFSAKLTYGWLTLEIDRYLGFTNIMVTADNIGLNSSWQNAVIFFTHPDNLCKKAQRSMLRQLSYNNASRCGFISKQTRLTMEHALAITTETKASSGSFAMLEATTCRCCVQINSRYTSGSFRSTKSLTGS